jgi:hypothetical protein
MSEEDLILALITHPAGYIVDLFAMLSVRGADEGLTSYEVEWDHGYGVLGHVPENAASAGPTWANFKDPRDAVAFFLKKREEFGLGLDLEAEAFRARTA